MSKQPLYRKEVIAHKRNQFPGAVLINTPFKYHILSWSLFCFVLLIALFMGFANYSETFEVRGYLSPSKPLAVVYPKLEGVIAEVYVQQGEDVKKGDKLFLIDTELEDMADKDFAIGKQIELRKTYLEKEIAAKKRFIGSLKKLRKAQYISVVEFNQKKEELMELENRKSGLEMEAIQYQKSRSYLIRSAIDGQVSSIILRQGQHVDSTKPLAKINPKNTALTAEIFIPVRKAGFVQQENQISIHYDAYPFERFGRYAGKIQSISQSILLDEEEDKPFKIGEPYYKASASLHKQSVSLYGKEKTLQSGMTFTAVIVGSKRKIWQWVLDPLFSYSGSLFS